MPSPPCPSSPRRVVRRLWPMMALVLLVGLLDTSAGAAMPPTVYLDQAGLSEVSL